MRVGAGLEWGLELSMRPCGASPAFGVAASRYATCHSPPTRLLLVFGAQERERLGMQGMGGCEPAVLAPPAAAFVPPLAAALVPLAAALAPLASRVAGC